MGIISLHDIKERHPIWYLVAVAGIALSITVAVILAGVYLVDAFNPYMFWDGNPPRLNALNQLLGGMLVAVYTPIGIATTFIALNTVIRKERVVTPAPELQSQIFLAKNALSLMLIAASFILIFILGLILPHIWTDTPNYYYTRDSPYSLIHNVIWFTGREHYIHENVTVTENGVNETISESVLNPNWVVPNVYLKLYPDIVVYYSFLIVIIFVGCLATYHVPVRRFLHRRIPIDFLPKILNLWPMGASLGELALATAVTALHCYWLWYWSAGWLYRPDTVYAGYTALQLWARVMGEMTILTSSFLTIPITHNCVWESVFGVPMDR